MRSRSSGFGPSSMASGLGLAGGEEANGFLGIPDSEGGSKRSYLRCRVKDRSALFRPIPASVAALLPLLAWAPVEEAEPRDDADDI